MYSLQLTDGDFDFSNHTGKLVYESDHLKQSLGLWLQESLHVDRFHFNYGSALQSMLGSNESDQLKLAISNETRRVIDNYAQQQSAAFNQHPELFSRSEIIRKVLLVIVDFIDDSLGNRVAGIKIWLSTMNDETIEMTYEEQI